MSSIDERDVNPIAEMTRIADEFLNLTGRGFKISYRSERPEKLIYDSQWCRISLIWGGWDQVGGNNMHIRYGRLHAPNEKIMMLWQGEECRCWHRIEHALHFLDGHAPADVARLRYSHPTLDPFYEEDIRKRFPRRQLEWLAQMQVTVWQQYGQRLFDLFDLRQPELWQQYRQFLKEVYDIHGRDSDIKPPMDKVC
ncbi:MAG: hypothetical protein HGB35_05010 [Geobacteraceae bacterium]|nr:hypothetical protein [Geobacteraceae bacterium]